MTVDNVLVTGATGRIGSIVSRRLQERGLVVHRAVRAGAARAAHDVELELDDELSTNRAVADLAPDAVVHLGAVVGPACDVDPALAQRVNVHGTAQLARSAAAAGSGAFVFMSSAAVYGNGAPGASPTPTSVYGRTKLEAEHALEDAFHASGTNAVALRTFNVYGRGMSGLPDLLTGAGAQVTLHGLDGFVRDYVHAVEVAEAVVRAVQRLGLHGPDRLAVDLGTGRATSNRRLVTDLGLAEGDRYVISESIDSRSVADIAPLRRWLGWNPTAWPGSSASAALDAARS